MIALCLFLAFLPYPYETRAADTHRYALALFHFNIQYVAGGLIGLFNEPLQPWMAGWEVSAEDLEDQIVTESFEPILDLYLSHPGWGVDIEFQGYFIEVLAERHPQVLEKLRTLALSGQGELVSFHYSDQLFIAYSREDLERSQRINRDVFERYDIPLSGTVFCQEGQASPGMAQFMEQHGFDVLVWPKNLYRYQHGEQPYQPYYSFGNVHMIIGPGSVFFNDGEIQVEWTFLDDGEKLATNDLDPYFPPFFRHDPGAVAEYELDLQSLEAQGVAISTVGRYVEDLKALGIRPADPGPLLEGTWQPDDTNGSFRWLGGAGLFFFRDERDSHVRSLTAQAHRDLVAAESLTGELENRGKNIPASRERLDSAWRLLALAEVSDATGINPFRGEVEYGIAHAAEALRIARDVIAEGKALLGYSKIRIDTDSGSITSFSGDVPLLPELDHALLAVTVDSPGRTYTETWQQVATDPPTGRVELAFSVGDGEQARKISVVFPGSSQNIVYCPALQEETPVSYPRSNFVWDHFILALPNGMIGLDERRFVIKDTGVEHVGAFIYPDRGDITFADETAPVSEPVTWVFYLVEGSVEDAVKVANGINIRPTLYR